MSITNLLRCSSLLLASASLVVSGHAKAGDMPPSIPGDIASRAYNAMSGGIRWTRSTDDRGVRGYEVNRDGSTLGVFDALSDIDRSLSAGRAYNYAVVAIVTAGQRSAQATVRLITPDAPPPTPTV